MIIFHNVIHEVEKRLSYLKNILAIHVINSFLLNFGTEYVCVPYKKLPCLHFTLLFNFDWQIFNLQISLSMVLLSIFNILKELKSRWLVKKKLLRFVLRLTLLTCGPLLFFFFKLFQIFIQCIPWCNLCN